MNMFKRKLKNNIKKELIRKNATYKILNNLIINVIKINNAWYDFNLQKRFEKFELEKVKLFQEERIKYRENKLIKELFYDDEIVLIKLNFIKTFKNEKLKEKREKQKRKEKKSETKCYTCEKKKHFVKDCRSINVMNQWKLNVLQTIFMKKRP